MKNTSLVTRLLAAATAAVVIAGAVALPAAAATAATTVTAKPSVQENLDRLTRADGFAGAVLQVRDARGRSRTYTSGTAARGTGRPMVGGEARMRAASMTKPVVAAAVLDQVARGRLDLDEKVETYLPGVLGGRAVTVRQLLQHTSGLPEYLDAIDWTRPGTPEEQLKLALAKEPLGEPGERWSYSNTNYLVAGMLLGDDFRKVVESRILRPYGMKRTYWPAEGELTIRGRHARNYGVSPADPKGGVADITELPGHAFGAAGGLVSTPADLNVFWQRLPASTLKTMTAGAVPADAPYGHYGLGVARVTTSCGRTVWMHDGGLPGVSVLSGRDAAGRAATVYVTGAADTPAKNAHLVAAFDSAFC
ncbi:serine hydrolase domain-containing protein [Nonomuraea sp. NPDC059194]|uniref:serine hydrolase domain-containing protein n=1 Tax=Nonomuraea sp. NPDC059194 TaxID=3346764 RepID=UPI0036CFA2DF